MSVDPPGANGTMMRTVLVGKSCCADADSAMAQQNAATSSRAMSALRGSDEPLSGTSADARQRCPPRSGWRGQRVAALSLHDHDLEILARHHERGLARDVHAIEEGGDVTFERCLPGGVQCSECLERRTIEVAKHLNPVRAGAVPKVEELSHASNVRGMGAEQRDHVRLGSPQRR